MSTMPHAERLEGRRLFSFTYSASDFQLVVNVNGYAKITESSPGTIVISDGCRTTAPITLQPGGFLTVEGSRGSDVIVVTASGDDYAVSVDGDRGDDILIVTNTAADNNSPFNVSGGKGNDLIVVNGGAVDASGGDGNDVLYVQGTSSVTWDGGSGHNIELGTA